MICGADCELPTFVQAGFDRREDAPGRAGLQRLEVDVVVGAVRALDRRAAASTMWQATCRGVGREVHR